MLLIAATYLWALQESWLRQSQREARAAIELQRLGALIFWSCRLDAHILENWSNVSDRGPSWLVPGDGFMEGVHLPLCRTPQLDQKLECLETASGLRYLNLGHAAITDAALLHLAGLTRLEWLDLHDTPLSDGGLHHLGSVAHLAWLNLGQTQVTDASLPILAGFKRLQLLNLTGTRITSGGLASLREYLPGARIETDFDDSPISQQWDIEEGLTRQESILLPTNHIVFGPRAVHERSMVSNTADADEGNAFPTPKPVTIIVPSQPTQ